MVAGEPTRPVGVIGAGIIGTAIAFELQRRGVETVLIDGGEPGRGASYGNMASIAITEFLPSSRPSVWRQVPKWLIDPEGPIRIRPAYLPKLAPWLMRFALAGLPSRVRVLEAAGAALCNRVHDDLRPLLKAAGLDGMLTEEGCLCLYADAGEVAADREHIEALRRHGIPHREIGDDELRRLEPAISHKITRAVLFPENRSVKDPYGLVLGLADAFLRLGGRSERGHVTGFTRVEGRIAAITFSDGRLLPVGKAIICAGARSHQLSRLLGDPLPLETERGYHTQIMSPGITLRHSIIWPAKAFMVTPTAGGIRVGGTVEMAGLDAAPDYRRADITVRRAREALPDLQTQDTTRWMGHRPAFPDTVPVIGPSPRVNNAYYATGHGHLGLTYAATTARLIGDLITGQVPPLDLTAYRVDRF